MGRTDKEISKSNKWYIPGERQLELEHFCLQYNYWDDCICDAVVAARYGSNEIKSTDISDPTYVAANKIISYKTKIEMIEKCLDLAVQNEIFTSDYEKERTRMMLKMNVTAKYAWLEGVDGLCPKNKFYRIRRKFFWLLDKMRD